jgi:hypothetical protein
MEAHIEKKVWKQALVVVIVAAVALALFLYLQTVS